MNDYIEVQGDVEKTESVTLFTLLDMEVGQPTIMSFVAEIGHLVSQEIDAHYYHGGCELGCVSGYVYTSLDPECFLSTPVMCDVGRFCSRYTVTTESSLIVKVHASQRVQPIIVRYGDGSQPLLHEERGVFGRRKYLPVPRSWAINRDVFDAELGRRAGASSVAIPARGEGDFLVPYVRNKAEVWSSALSPEENVALLVDYNQKYKVRASSALSHHLVEAPQPT